MTNELPLDVYVTYAVKQVRVIWLGRQAHLLDNGGAHIGQSAVVPVDELVAIFKVLGIRTYQWTIEGHDEWKVFADSAYVLTCKGGKTWRDPDGVKLSLHRLADQMKVERHDNHFAPDVIMTVFDQVSRKRLIVDGTSRSVILTRENDPDSYAFSQNMYVWECSGVNVNAIFPADIHQLRDPYAEIPVRPYTP